jgi:carbamate kinase
MDQPATIIAIITTKQENLSGGGVPVFITKSKEALQKVSGTLEKTLDASAHEVDEDTMIIVAH